MSKEFMNWKMFEEQIPELVIKFKARYPDIQQWNKMSAADWFSGLFAFYLSNDADD